MSKIRVDKFENIQNNFKMTRKGNQKALAKTVTENGRLFDRNGGQVKPLFCKCKRIVENFYL